MSQICSTKVVSPASFSSHLTITLARQVAALVRSLPVNEQPERIIVSRKGMLDPI